MSSLVVVVLAAAVLHAVWHRRHPRDQRRASRPDPLRHRWSVFIGILAIELT